MRVTTVGSAMLDTFLEYPCASQLLLRTEGPPLTFQLLQEGIKIELQDIQRSVGGGACNTAVSFARLGYEATIVAAVAVDHTQQHIITSLRANGVNTNALTHHKEQKGGISFIIPCAKGDRVALVYRGANNLLSVEHVLAQLITVDVVYFSSLHTALAEHISVVAQQAQRKARLVACNPGSSQLKQQAALFCNALTYFDILIVNAHEAGLVAQALNLTSNTKLQHNTDKDLPKLLAQALPLAGCPIPLQEFLHAVHTIGPRLVIVTNGSEGVYVSDGTQILFQASDNSHVVSTLGAGDAFGSCFVALWAAQEPLEVCIRSAVHNSISVLQHLDTQTGLLTRQAVAARQNKLQPMRTFRL